MSQTSLDFFRTIDTSTFTWIPKPLVYHHDMENNTYWKSSRELLDERLRRLDVIAFNNSLLNPNN